MKIIGIDPGLTKTGVGIIEVKGNNLYYVFSDTIYTSPNDDLSSRLSKFHHMNIKIKLGPDNFLGNFGTYLILLKF